jgi:hypothetical protein
MPCVPGDLVGVSGRVRFRRRFGYPGRIDPHERVWVVVEGLTETVEAAVNGVPVAPLTPSPLQQGPGEQEKGAAEIDVTTLLRERNELTLDVKLSPGSVLWDEVALEVRCTASLRSVKIRVEEGKIHVCGEVVGVADRPLELYLIADRSPTAYVQVVMSGEAQPFDLATDECHQDGKMVERVKIDLVKGASVWYTVESAVPARNAQNPGA